jgi:cell division control protein 6
MTKYDDLFEETAPEDSVFTDKHALDPLAEPEEIVARDEQEHTLARLLNGVHEGYLPPTVTIYGPPGTGKTLTTRRVCEEFAARHEGLAIEYVNLKECRTLFSAANEILLELTGARRQAYEGLDGVFEGIWEALADYPEWTVLILDEIDHIKHDSNYDPNDFFYRLLRGEGKLKREIQLSVWLLSNELLEVDLRLDSRVQSVLSDESVFFPPYQTPELAEVLAPRLERAFRAGAISQAAMDYGINMAAMRWGDARKALTLFRRAGETANERGLDEVTQACLDANLEGTDKEATIDKLLSLPVQHFFVLVGVTSWSERLSGEIVQPVTTDQVTESYQKRMDEQAQISERAVREILTDLETMGLVETWVQSKGREGRVKQIETTFEPAWVQEALDMYVEESSNLRRRED